eukprot:scaffold297_cov164-Ochromonas_danica.AAC.17
MSVLIITCQTRGPSIVYPQRIVARNSSLLTTDGIRAEKRIANLEVGRDSFTIQPQRPQMVDGLDPKL